MTSWELHGLVRAGKSWLQAALSKYAVDAAPDLRRFQQSRRIAHPNGMTQQTPLGHSYGTTTVGVTASNGVDAGRIVFVASPGTGVSTAAELQLSRYSSASGRVWATIASNDPILVLLNVNDHMPFGANPASPGYGGCIFESVPLEDSVLDQYFDLEAHSAYRDDGNPSRKMIAKIVVGAVNGTTCTATMP